MVTPQQSENPPQFSELGIGENFLEVLEKNRFTTPTPIQHQVIPVALQGKDVVGIAQTGTGKTLAFGIPMIQRLALHKGQGLILLPTRELALQVDHVLQQVGASLGLRTAVIMGGASAHQQRQSLGKKPHIIIATPGRLVDFLDQKMISLQQIRVVVLDEADRMLDIGFMPQIRKILELVPRERQTMLFSATMPPAIAQIAAKYMALPLRIEVAPAGTSSANVEQEMFIVDKSAKIRLLEKLLKESQGSVLVFSRTKYGAKRIAAAVNRMGHTAAELHSNRSLSQRKAALDGFKSGKFRVLVATDIAARGIDVTGISLVINYDLPDNSEDYVHRIGRTGRAGRLGKAVSFATPDERASIREIEKLIRKTLPIMGLPELPPAPAGPQPELERSTFGRGRQQHGGRNHRSPARHGGPPRRRHR